MDNNLTYQNFSNLCMKSLKSVLYEISAGENVSHECGLKLPTKSSHHVDGRTNTPGKLNMFFLSKKLGDICMINGI